MSSPSMVHRSGDTLVVRSVVSGDALYQDADHPEEAASILDDVDDAAAAAAANNDANDGDDDELDLPQCKIKRNYTCPSCDYYSQNPRSYLYHLKDVHKQKIRVYECPSCLYASKHSQKLQRHVHMVHVMNKRGKQKMNTSKKKAKKAAVVAILPRHTLASVKPVVTSPPPAYDTTTAASNQLLSAAPTKLDDHHAGSAVGGGPGELLTCSLCGFATRNVSAMSRHEKLVHLKKRFFRCSKCNYVTHMRARYTKHVKYHSMPMIKCDLCDFRTPYKWNLDRHYKNHQGDGAYKCSLCNFTADIKQSLTVHEMNHHVPPVGLVAGAGTGRRRNKVGASDSMQQGLESDAIDQEELELLRLERENEEEGDSNAGQQVTFYRIPVINTESTMSAKQNNNNQQIITIRNSGLVNNTQKAPKIKISFKKLKVSNLQLQSQSNLAIQPNIKCKHCNFKASWDGELTLHEIQAHSAPRRSKAAKKVPRPIPNLIPIQNKTTTSPPPMGSLPILKIPSVRPRPNPSLVKHIPVEQPADNSALSEKDLNDICAKSCPNSSLRDFASLMGGDTFIDQSAATAVKSEPKSDDDATSSTGSPDPKSSSVVANTSTTFKKKNASFFDKLKEKLMVGTGETCNLTCWCGHESKCLSELMRHQKLHNEGRDIGRGLRNGGTILTAGAELSSTRCQHCRQRCKTSADLYNHLQSCLEANKTLNSSASSHEDPPEDLPDEVEETLPQPEPVPEQKEVKVEESQGPHPMENKVFVWNSMPQPQEAECEEECLQQMPPDALPNEEDSLDASVRSKSPISEGSLVGIETAPGYGAVTTNVDQDANAVAQTDKPVKKVFKCPHCTFWASTASRFHVHIVGHLNKKPFECSLCAYRSNWRWDITKHIRLKSARDPNHEKAGVLMTDETGRRNYSKYNKYLTMMRVHEPSAESSGSGRRTKGADATQGSATKTQLSPHLAPAPPPATAASSTLRTGPLRPPPPLRAAHLVLFPSPAPLRPKQKKVAAKRVSRGIFDQDAPPAKRPSVDGKKTLWKCKKCNFRDARRELVMAHVKEHYQQRELQQMATAAATSATAPDESYADGERHCRLKHSGDVQVVRGGRFILGIEDTAVEETSEQEAAGVDGTKQCEICPYSSLSSNEMAIHKEHHSSWPGASYKCSFCLYFVSQKKDLVTHLRLHGISDPEDHIAKTMQGKSPAHHSSDDENDELGLGDHGSDSSPTKRYKCVGCPYVSNSKSQFLYHKQFHRPRGAPFKCGLCSYNVSRRHLLHQHLRVHGIVIPPQKSPPKHPGGGFGDEADGADDEIEEVMIGSPHSADLKLSDLLDTKTMPDIPLVWVSRGTNFFKMFKCRFCPHVNVRKANIHEHEKMHSVRTKEPTAATATSVEVKKEPGTQAAAMQQHYCPDCNYICNNAGVLSSHAKVHQGVYGRVHRLVDATRSDEAQLRELANDVGDVGDDEADMTTTREYSSADDMDTTKQAIVEDYSVRSVLQPAEFAAREEKDARLLYFCSHCPARFLFEKELGIHLRFHDIRLLHRCESCSYTARQQPHLMAHHKVHADEYQERTNQLVAMYRTSPQHPRPRTAVIVEGPGVLGAVWVVIGGGNGGETHMEHSTDVDVKPAIADANRAPDVAIDASAAANKVPGKQYSCDVCPATFFKGVALQYHMTLHGGTGPHRCRFCNYAVKTYGNLVKHEMIHGSRGKNAVKTRVLLPAASVPTSGTELFEHRAEARKNEAVATANGYALTTYFNSPPPPLHVDPQFGTLMHGNPDYVYPTYFKNGRLKEKRYKCHKCPSAFEKREQYKVHLTLHGAKQRYRCEKCDYSVKYYANYSQHMKKHETNDNATTSRKPDSPRKEGGGNLSDQSTDERSEGFYEDKAPATQSVRSAKTICAPSANLNGPLQLSAADRQSLMLQQLKRSACGGSQPETEEPKKSFCCPHCPYTSQRKDGVESHVKRHEAVSGVRGAFVCDHCDYSVPQQHFLREHNKVHFTSSKKQPDAYMKCSRIELWVENQGKENVTEEVGTQTDQEEEKVVVFKDLGSIKPDVERFYPTLVSDPAEAAIKEEEKVYMNILTGEPIGEDELQLGSPGRAIAELDTMEDDVVTSPLTTNGASATDVKMEQQLSECGSPSISNAGVETGLKLVADSSHSTVSLSSASLNEDSKMDVMSDCDTNDSENDAKDEALVGQNAEDSDCGEN